MFSTEVLTSNLCDYNDTYVPVRGDIINAAHNHAISVAFKNCTPFTKCITKIDGTIIGDAGDLDLTMLMYNVDRLYFELF